METKATPEIDCASATSPPPTPRSRIYPWVVLALILGLMLSDYMSRQVLSSIYPFLKQEWDLSDAELASFHSVVALMVGLLALPLSILADRWGRVKSIVLMATIWSVATLLCAVAAGYEQMLAARFLVGVGEAAFGSAGIAVIFSVFAARLRASLSGAFYAAGAMGSVIGVALGGTVATSLGWRWSFGVMAVIGFVLAGLFSLVVTDRRIVQQQSPEAEAPPAESGTDGYRAPLSSLFSSVSVVCAYATTGLQMFTVGALTAWLPSFFNRYYSLAPDRAGAVAAVYFLAIGLGMLVGGIATDRICRNTPDRRWSVALALCAVAALLLIVGFGLEPGPPQLALLAGGALCAASISGGITSVVASLTHPSLRASAFGTVTMSNSVFGLALGPFVVGLAADRIGLDVSLQWAPLAYVAAGALLIIGRRTYSAGVQRVEALRPDTSVRPTSLADRTRTHGSPESSSNRVDNESNRLDN
ncbi:MFS transporter [Rhodococcus aetherivorans]|uniref:MFS transporter n=1 Tax=Rhodococcus aetherivorans TaxID=191292 RepID=UPI0031D5FCBD